MICESHPPGDLPNRLPIPGEENERRVRLQCVKKDEEKVLARAGEHGLIHRFQSSASTDGGAS